ncbi:MAG: carboxypeptidase regulatory-like domain-containing protein [Bryobacteraceae bacterium]
MKRYFTLGACLLVLTYSLSTSGWAQSFNATISGRVQDPSDAAVPDAVVTLISLGTGASSKTKTDSVGAFSFPNLQSGAYELKASAAGFKEFVQSGITIVSNQVSRVPVTLEIGAASQTVEVAANASALNYDTPEVKSTIAPETLQELPLLVAGITRSAVSFVKLLPGVVEAGGPDNRQFSVHINGGMTMGDEAVLDGISSNDGSLGQGGILLQITGHPWSPEALGEITLLTSNYEPQYGSTTSAVTTGVTKSGTNEIHGSLYENFRNTVLNAKQYSLNPNQQRPKDLENDYGFTIGGPIKIPKLAWTPKRKTYGFFNYGRFAQRGGVSVPTYSVPSLKERAGDFTDWRDANGNLIPIYDPNTTRRDPATGELTRDQFMGCDGHTPNVICPADPRLQNSLAKQWFQYLPTPTNSNPLLNFTPRKTPATEQTANTWLFDLRVDHLVGDKDRFYFVWHDWVSPNVDPQLSSLLALQISATGTNTHNSQKLLRGSWDHTFSPTLLNNLNLGYNNIRGNTGCVDQPYVGSVPKITGVPNSNDFPPTISLQGFLPMGCNSASKSSRPSFIGNDLLTWVRGRHTFKMGAEFRNQQTLVNASGGDSGNFSFSPLNTGLTGVNSGSSVASFLLGAVNSANVTLRSQGSQYGRQPYLAFYAGDSWKYTSKLTLTFGVRWDLAYPVHEKHDVLSFFDPYGANAAAGGRLGRLAFAGDRWGDASYGKPYPESIDYKAFAPRVGFAYAVNPKTVVRGGYGIFYSQIYYTGWGAGIGGGASGFNSNPTFSSTDGGITPAFLLQNGFPAIAPGQIPPFVDSTFNTGQSIGLYRGRENGRPPYSQQWNLTIERQLTKDSYTTLAYVANKGTRLISDLAPINVLNPQLLSMGSKLYDNFAPGQATLDGVSAPYPGWAAQMTGCAPSVAQALLPYPQYCGTFSSADENAGNSTFHSLQAKFEKRFTQGTWILASYTFSKLISDADDVERVDSGSGGTFSPFGRQRAKAISPSDVPHSFSGTVVYQLPFGKGHRFLDTSGVVDKLAGGWELTSIFRGSSGIPFIVRSGQCNVPSQFRAACVPALIPGANPFAQELGGGFNPNKPLLNINAFEQANQFNFYTGAGSRTTNFRGFPYFGHDVSLIKSTRLSERVAFQLRGEFFNIWNWHRFVAGGAWGQQRAFIEDVSSPDFGMWSGAISPPRNIQLGAKVIF